MSKILPCLISLSLFFLLGACSRGSSSKLSVTTSFTLGAQGFTGGLVVIATSGIKRKVFTASSGRDVALSLESENWKFQIVGWDGPTAFTGTAYCGSKLQTLTDSDAVIKVPVEESSCVQEDFSGAGYVPFSGGTLKSMSLFSCSSLVDSSLNPLSNSTPQSGMSPFCDANPALVTPASKQTARSWKVSIMSDTGAPAISTGCLTNPSVGALPINGVPFRVELFDYSNCTGSARKYEFPNGFLAKLGPDVVLSTSPSSFNALFLKFQYALASSYPLTADVTKSAGQPATASSFPVNFKVTFNRAIHPASFTAADLSNTGTATVNAWTITTSNNIDFNVSVTSANSGTIIPQIASGSVTDFNNITNLDSTNTTGSVSFTLPPLSITIARSPGQADKVLTAPISFNVIFSHPIDSNSFDPSDIYSSGSATVSSWAIVSGGDNQNFTIIASPATYGTILPSIPASLVFDTYSTPNIGSVLTDSGVDYLQTFNFSPFSLNFSPVPSGHGSQIQTFTFTNSGASPITGCLAPYLSGTNPAEFEIYRDDCGTDPLAVSASCTVKVKARPTSRNTKTATLKRFCTSTFVTTADDGISITPSSGLKFSAPTISLGQVRAGYSSRETQIYVRNESSITLTGCSFSHSGTGDNDFLVSNSCTSSSMPAWSSCPITVKASPTSAGSFSDTFTMNCGGDIANITLIATGVSVNAQKLAVGGNVSCVLRFDGTVQCWGFGNWGQLTNPARFSQLTPYEISESGITDISVGDQHTCAVKSDTTVKCWGHGPSGELGHNSAGYQVTTPVTASGATGAAQVALGKEFSCLLTTGGAVSCWGKNNYGQLGDGTTTNRLVPVNGPSGPFIALSAGDTSACAVNSTGDVYCWGQNTYGQLGNGNNTNSTTAVQVSGINNAHNIASGDGFHCAILTDTTVKCWGKNNNGQLGDGTTTNRNAPVSVSGLSNVQELAKGGGGVARHMCVFTNAGDVKCWGANNLNQLGFGALSSAVTTFGTSSGLSNTIHVQRGANHTCVMDNSYRIKCFGDPADGQLGRGHVQPYVPVQISGLSNIQEVILGENSTCARDTAGTVYCWGMNKSSQMGTGSTEPVYAPTAVSGVTGVTALHGVGYYDSFSVCADSSGTVKCWGGNGSGLLGFGDTTNRSAPATQSVLSNVISMGGGSFHLCGLFNDGKFKCAGANSNGQIGLGSTSGSVSSFTSSSVLSTDTITQLSGGFGTGYAVRSDGTAWAWGYGTNGNLGDGSSTSSVTEVQILLPGSVTQVLGVYTNACAIHDGGKVSCWGEGGFQLGGGPSYASPTTTPQPVFALGATSQLAGGKKHVCALVSGRVWCWGGQTQNGEVGYGGLDQVHTPVPILDNVVSLWKGEGATTHSCAIKTDGTLWCWGNQNSFNPPLLTTEVVSGYGP